MPTAAPFWMEATASASPRIFPAMLAPPQHVLY
jgi:hypothetical protein